MIGQERIISDQRIPRKASEHHYDSMSNICPLQFVKSANAFPQQMLVIVPKGLPTAGFYQAENMACYFLQLFRSVVMPIYCK